MMPDLSLIIPFYNEEQNAQTVLTDMLKEFKKNKVSVEIIAVDNGSHDKTAQILSSFSKKNKSVKVVTVKINRGYGYGLQQGFKAASGAYVGYCNGDNQVRASDVYRIYNALATQNVALVKALRHERSESLLRIVESRVFNLFFKVLFLLGVSDINGSPKMMTKKALKMLQPNSDDWFIDAELVIKAKKFRMPVLEVPVTSFKREKGASKVYVGTSFEFVKNAIRYKLRGY